MSDGVVADSTPFYTKVAREGLGEADIAARFALEPGKSALVFAQVGLEHL